MLVLSVPALSFRLGQSDAGNDPISHTTRQAYDLLTQGFGKGFNGPLQVVARLPRPDDAQATLASGHSLRATPGIASVTPAVLIRPARPPCSRPFPPPRRNLRRPRTL